MGRSSRSPTPSRSASTSRTSSAAGGAGSAFHPRALPGADGGNARSNNAKLLLPPTLPAETNPHHRASLARSLSRNDAELAALNKLNVTLRRIRDEIVDRYGEGMLLDVGEGLIRLRTGDLGRENDVQGVEVGVVRVVQRGIASGGSGGGGAGGGSPGTPGGRSGGGSPTKPDGSIGGTEPAPDLDDNFPPDEIPLTPNPNDDQTTLLRSFLLRMKLRRRLLNRLCRRLNRVGRAMDGEDTSPPPPPKYGDMRFEAEKGAVKEFMTERERREGARKRVLGRRMAEREEGAAAGAEAEYAAGVDVKAEPEQPASIGEAPSDAAAVVKADPAGSSAARASDDATGEQDKQYVEDLSALIEAEPGYDKIVTYTTTSAVGGGGSGGSPGKKSPSTTATSPIKIEGGSDEGGKQQQPVGEGGGGEEGGGVSGKDADAAATAATATPTKATPSSDISPSKSVSSVAGTPSKKSPSSKPSTATTVRKSVTYALAAEEPSLNSEGESTEDHVRMPYGTGIGATHRTMNSREREVEFGRWKADVLGRLPDQCTFDEIGYGNRVFGLEERRRRAEAEAREEEGGGGDEKEEEKEDVEKEVEDEQQRQDADDGMDVDEEGNKKGDEDHEDEEGENKKKNDEEGENKKNEKKRGASDDQDGDGDEEAQDNADADKKDTSKPGKEKKTANKGGPSHTPNKKTKLLTLALVPSFHDQDLRRTQMIQRDMMTHHMLENCRGRIRDATEDYNRSFKLSTDLHNRKNRVSADLQKAQYAHRVVLSKARNDHALEVAIARAKWQKRKDAWEAERRARGAAVAAANAAGYGASAVFQAQTQIAQQQQQQQASASSSSSGGVSGGVRAEVADALTNVVDRAVVLNSARGVAVGTPVTTAASVRTDQPVTSEVASTLAHVVDAVSHRIESQLSSGRTPGVGVGGIGGGGPTQGQGQQQQQQAFEPFVPPPPPRDVNAVDPATGETLAQTHERIESQLRRDLATLTANLAVAEEDRKKSWRKMLKVKAEMEPKIASLTGQTGTAYQRRKAGGAGYAPAAGAGSYAPPLPRGASAGGAAAAAYAPPTRQPPGGGAYNAGAYAGTAAGRAAAAAVATSNAKAAAAAVALAASRGGTGAASSSSAPPAAASGAASGGERSKYSAENIRARKASDGSIVPVTMPKKDKDGLFMRPAGRKRKGMDWDAVRGVWIPAPGALGSEDW